MWKLLPRTILLKGIGLIFTATLIYLAVFLLTNPNGIIVVNSENAFRAIELYALVTLIVYGIVWLLAKHLWKLAWKLPLLGTWLSEKLCPDLNGIWSGVVHSSFMENELAVSKDVELIVKADFLGFDIKFNSVDGYQRSTVVQCDLYRDARNGELILSYIFEGVVFQPKESDDSKYDGAAKLTVVNNNGFLVLRGTYWTNRAWQRGNNTAGTIELTQQ